MNNILTIAKKEFLDTIRDRRTLLTMFVIPLLGFPIIIYIIAAVQISIHQKAAEKTLKVGIVSSEAPAAITDRLEKIDNINLITPIALADTTNLIKDDSLDMVVWVDNQFMEAQDSLASGIIHLYYQSTDDDQLKRRVLSPIIEYEESLLAQRLEILTLSSESIDPISIVERDVSSQQEVLGQSVGGFLPYIFILFCFMGCMYPAIDLFTGEKERGTLETILTLPVQRVRFLLGKMIVVASSGIISALLALIGLFLSARLIAVIPPEILEIISDILKPTSVLLLLGMLIPLSIFFAGLLIPFATYAKTFKEAQSLITPLNFLVIIPAALGLTPGIELNTGTALIPILNIALSTKEIVAGTFHYGLLALVFGSLILLAVLSIFFSVNWFSRESNILRT